MVFNSIPFIVFFITFFFLYWFAFNKQVTVQNSLLLAGNYIFVAWVDWRFLLLLVITSLANFILGLCIGKTENERHQRYFVFAGLFVGLGVLLFFKYYNFFITSLTDAFSLLNINLHSRTLILFLPLGISFYTFRAISYLLDIESGKYKATTDWVAFFAYLSFFPTFLSGPIDKARDFIPQLEKRRTFEYSKAADGLRQILWGLFKKVVIADCCNQIIDPIFETPETFSASTLLMGAFLYTIQLYADFSGYSDMAIGIARLLGFNVTKNFNYPFFAQNISVFWQRWHMSLTTWMTEYVFTPLSFIFRTFGKAGIMLAIIINFILVGLWHGANWTFIIYGFLHGLYFIPLLLRGTLNTNKTIANGQLLPTLRELFNMAGTFILIMLTLIIFKAETIWQALFFYKHLLSSSILSTPEVSDKIQVLLILVYISIMFIIEWVGGYQEYAMAKIELSWPKPARWALYYGIIISILWFGAKEQEFIYFQF